MALKFQTRILLALGLLTAVALAPVFVTVYTAIRAGVNEHARAELDTGSRVFGQLMQDRDAQLLNTVQVMASDYGFKRAVATGDTATILSVLDNHGGRIGASEALVVSLKGDVLSSTVDLSDTRIDQLMPDLIRKAENQRYAQATLFFGGAPHQFVMVPVNAPRRVAWVAMGFVMDKTLVAKLKTLTGLEVSFVSYDETRDADTPLPSTLAAARLRNSLAQGLAAQSSANKAYVMQLRGAEYLSLALPLNISHGRGVSAVLQKSLVEARKPYSAITQKLITVSLLALIVALVSALFLARSVTRPVETLAKAARRIGQGDYQHKVEVTRQDELGALAEVVNNMQSAIAERELKIAHQAFHDALTGLPNRALAHDRLQFAIARAQRDGHAVGVLMIDVDRFKEINDTLGHHTGDKLLIELGRRLIQAVRASDTVARLGGDEFLMLVECDGLNAAMHVGDKIVKVLCEPMRLEDVEVTTDVSIGIAIYPDHGNEPGILLRRADIAMYEAKTSRRSPCAYQPGREEEHLYRLALINDLRRAIPNDELLVHYQPKVELGTGKVTHVEALMRWQHPRYGMVRPDEFIPLAEQSGRIRQLTAWLLDTVVKDTSEWQRRGFEVGAAINVSVVDLASLDLPTLVAACLQKYNLDPKHLILEITESAVMRDATGAIEILHRLRDVGVRLAIDDFGTGYSSLSQLKRMPVDELKIDKSFVRELTEGSEDEVIVKSTIELGHNMGLRIVAEGVETERSWTLLRAHRCDMAQGYLISKPLPRGDFITWLTHHQEAPPSWGAGAEPALQRKIV